MVYSGSCTRRYLQNRETRRAKYSGSCAMPIVSTPPLLFPRYGHVLKRQCAAATLSSEIGYGNAAGLLFRKGLSGPPEARIEDLPDEDGVGVGIEERNPITSLRPDASASGAADPLAGLTQEEKEREAERLFVLFDRMERNPVISAQSSSGAATSAKDIMRAKLERGELESDDLAEDAERREQERKDEEEAMADLRRYKERKGR